jgi:hypothetical protein
LRCLGISASTNVYLIRSSAPLVKPATVRLLFSERSHGGSLYGADHPGGSWRAIGSIDPAGLPYYQGETTALPAYFVGGRRRVRRRGRRGRRTRCRSSWSRGWRSWWSAPFPSCCSADARQTSKFEASPPVAGGSTLGALSTARRHRPQQELDPHPAPVFSLTEPPTSGLPSPRGDHYQ